MSSTLNYQEPASGQDNPWVVGGTFKTGTGENLRRQVITTRIEDVSTAGQVYVYVPYAGTLSKVSSVLNGAIITADATLTVKTQAGTAGTIVIANAGSAAGDIDSLSPSSNNAITAGSLVEIETDGASGNTVGVDISLEILIA